MATASINDLFTIIGEKEVQIKLRDKDIDVLKARVRELEDKYEPKKEDPKKEDKKADGPVEVKKDK